MLFTTHEPLLLAQYLHHTCRFFLLKHVWWHKRYHVNLRRNINSINISVIHIGACCEEVCVCVCVPYEHVCVLYKVLLYAQVGMYIAWLSCVCMTGIHTVRVCLRVPYSPWPQWLWPGSPGAVLLWSWPADAREDGNICICPASSDPWCSPYTRWRCSRWSRSWCCQPGEQICSRSRRESNYRAGTRDTPDTHITRYVVITDMEQMNRRRVSTILTLATSLTSANAEVMLYMIIPR